MVGWGRRLGFFDEFSGVWFRGGGIWLGKLGCSGRRVEFEV